MKPPFKKILIANRGEIACRIMRTAQIMGIRTVAVYSEADVGALHVSLADESVCIGAPPVTESYLQGARIIQAAIETGASAIHPGYGFLSENPEFVDAVEAAGLCFIGPSASAIRSMGLKDAAKTLMIEAGVPVVPGYQGSNQAPDTLAKEAHGIGYPVLIKARAGGGGKGMRKVLKADDFHNALDAAKRESMSAFGDDCVLIEKFISAPRHIEVQVFGDSHGNVVHLFERDCSLQRRHQKVIEEAPAPGMNDKCRAAMTRAAVNAAKAIQYEGAGTIEFIVDGSNALQANAFWFMEMNTRLQVEHPVTEAITGIDLVEWQLRIAAGELLPCRQSDLTIKGHAVEARLYAEDPSNGFLPATGTIHQLSFHSAARNDTGVRSKDEISPWYDPMIAKIITHAENRGKALGKMEQALSNTQVVGTHCNAEFLLALVKHDAFANGRFDTELIDRNLDSLCSTAYPSEEHIALAAFSALELTSNDSRQGWCLWGASSQLAKLQYGELTLGIKLIFHDDQSITININDASDQDNKHSVPEPPDFQLTLQNIYRSHGTLSAQIGHSENNDYVGRVNKKVTAQMLNYKRDGATLVSVQINGLTHTFTVPDARAGRANKPDNSNQVIAPMTGVLIKLAVSVGDEVQAGDVLGLMEAMKMETSLTSPRNGKVSKINVEAGQAVEGGAVVIALHNEPQGQ